jgi:hypothetical protein
MSYAAFIAGANSSVGTGNNAPNNVTDASFRGWAQMVANGFISAGWARAADSGNINFATVSTPVSGQLSAGYDIFRMTDTLNVAAPVFVKVEYGSGVANTGPSLWVTVGSGSNGAGSLLGATTARTQLVSIQGVNAIGSFISGDTNRIQMSLWSYSNVYNSGVAVLSSQVLSWVLSIERTHDNSGSDTTEGALCLFKSGAITGYSQQYWNSVTGSSGVELSWGMLFPETSIGLGTAVQSSFYPAYLSNGVYVNPAMGVLGFIGSTTTGQATIATEGCPVPVQIYGGTHTYMPMMANTAGSCPRISRGTGIAAQTYAIRYE